MPETLDSTSSPERQPGDRRSSLRFPLCREVKHHGLSNSASAAGSGETINISSRGVLFRTSDRFKRGEWIELAISWPARLNQQIALQLVARGPIVRVDGDTVAISIQQHEFKTQSPARTVNGRDAEVRAD
jgi:hypothetical protein